MTPGAFKHALLHFLVVALLTYSGAWASAAQMSSGDGLPILWLGNGITLAFLLWYPPRHWWWIALTFLASEVMNANHTIFPLNMILLFALINLGEAMLAAVIIRYFLPQGRAIFVLRGATVFLLAGPLLAAVLGALLASWSLIQANPDMTILTLWRMWWFADALGMLIMTPLILACAAFFESGYPEWNRRMALELAAVWILILLLAMQAFAPSASQDAAFHITPLQLIPLALWPAARLGIRAAVLTSAFITLLATLSLSQGIHFFQGVDVQHSLWLTQEYLTLLLVMSLGLAILMREIQKHRGQLENRVAERTTSLHAANEALSEANVQLRKLVSEDFLTGIANRRYFHRQAGRLLDRLLVDQSPASLIILDLDNFKHINDSFGHDAGDQALQALVEPVKDCIRPNDLFGRLGGEEFVLLLPETRLGEAETVAEWQRGESLDQLLSRADKALYLAKESGRNCIRLAS